MSGQRRSPPAVWKRVLFSLLPALALFGVLEVALAALDLPSGSGESLTLRNRHDPGGREVRIDPATAHQLSENLLLHIRDNVLTSPDPELMFRVRPNPGGGPIHGYTGINAQGFRGRALAAPPAGARVVLVVGDSCGFGWGLRDFDRTFAARLERLLADRGEPVVVYNLSQPGYSTTQTRALYERWAPALSPDVVILYQGWNDLWKSAGRTDREILDRLHWLDRAPTRWIARSRVYRLLESGVRAWWPASAPSERAAAGEARRVPMPESIENQRAVVDDARTRGARVLWISPPFSAVAHPSLRPMGTYARRMREALGDRVEVVEVPEMEAGDAGSPAYFQDDAFHPNDRGAERLAEVLAGRIAAGPADAAGS